MHSLCASQACKDCHPDADTASDAAHAFGRWFRAREGEVRYWRDPEKSPAQRALSPVVAAAVEAPPPVEVRLS
eukprot:12926899-Prorocentrum_lima.AAC.1